MERCTISKEFIAKQSAVCPQYAKLIRKTIKDAENGQPIIESKNEYDACIIPFKPFFLPAINIPLKHITIINAGE